MYISYCCVSYSYDLTRKVRNALYVEIEKKETNEMERP